MKKYLPFILFGVGAVVLIVVFLFIRGRGGSEVEDENAFLRDIPLAERPYTTLTPKEDGHYLNLVIEGIKVADAKKLDYELVYSLPDGRQQGVPGTVDISSIQKVERPLLLGSESSGKFRYDEGVTNGTLSIRFRNDKGKLIGKLATDFHLEKDPAEATSVDGKLKYKFTKASKNIFFVTMNSFGLPKAVEGVKDGPYAVLASKAGPYPGTVAFSGNVSRYDGTEYKKIENGVSPDIGVFISTE